MLMASNGRATEPKSPEDDDEDCDIIPINDYNVEEGKLRSSFLWLVTRVYGTNIPDALCTPFYNDEKGSLLLKPPAIYSLVSGELYCLAAAKVFSEPGFIQQDHNTVLQTLHSMSIGVMDANSGDTVTETMLNNDKPMRTSAHLGMIDSLMIAHMKMALSVEKIVNAVKKYTTVHQNEEPIDLEDALLFWVNKICSTVRDAVEKKVRGPEHMPVIPEMEDLYEDMCDGACIAVLLSFYMPDKLPLNEICLNEPMSIADCVYNLQLVRRFCHMNYPYNPCHFEVEDILYLHEGLRPNVQALLTDIFNFVELTETENLDPSPPPAPAVRHRFERVKPIPGLREYPPSSNKMTLTKMGQRQFTGPASHAPSLMNSADSLMTQKSVDSLKYARVKERSNQNSQVPGFPKSPTTSFGEMKSAGNTPARNVRNAFDTLVSPSEPNNPYQRSDSMPSASVRLALEEKKRQLQSQKAHELSQKAQEQQEIGKQAFFNIMGKPQPKASDKLLHTTNGAVTALRQKRLGGGDGEQFDQLNKSVQQLQHQIQQLSMEQHSLQQHVRGEDEQRLQHAISHSALYPPANFAAANSSGSNFTLNSTSPSNFAQHQAGLTNGQGHSGPGNFATLPGNFSQQQQPQHNFGQNATGNNIYASPVNQQQQQFMLMQPQMAQVPQQQAQGGPPSPGLGYALPGQAYDAAINQQQNMLVNSSANAMAGAGAFRLHMETEPASRLDPSLQLNRGANLTNFGMTYRVNNKTPRRTWDSQTFANAGFGPAGMNNNMNDQMAQSFSQFQFQQQQNQPMQQVPAGVAQFGGGDTFRISSQSGGSRPPSYPSVEGSTPSPGPVGDYPQQQQPVQQLLQQALQQDAPLVMLRNEERRLSSTNGGTQFVPTSSTPTAPPQATPVTPQQSTDGGVKEASPCLGFVVGGNEEQEKLEQRKEQLLANAMRRQEMMEKRKEKMEADSAAKRAKEQAKQEEAERKKMEKEVRRQKVLEEYQKRKAEQEQLENTLSMGSGASTPGNSGTPRTTRIMRGHSQPPRPKSQVFSAKRNDAVGPSTSSDNLNQMSVSAVSAPPSTAEPTLKLFVKPTQKSNRNLVYNAIQYSVLAGAVHDTTKRQVLQEFAKSESKHFLLLFRDGAKMQYRGLYMWDEQSDTTHKLHGTGPKLCAEAMMDMMFKYDSGGKKFSYIPSKHLSATIDGFTIKDEYWQKKKQPFSGNR